MFSTINKNTRDKDDQKNVDTNPKSQTSSSVSADNTNPKTADSESQEQRRKILQLVAEIDNLQKKHYQDLNRAKHVAIKSFALDMCSVLDNINLAIQAINKTNTNDDQTNNQWQQNILQGLMFIQKHTLSTLQKYQIIPIKSEQNMLFDPKIHEAIQKIHHDSCPEGHICETVRQGYMLDQQVLRPAQVLISLGTKT